jgi:hypothetical protein
MRTILVGILVTGIILIFLSGCAKEVMKDTSSTPTSAKPLKGVSLSPDSFNQEGFTSFLEKAKQAGSIIGWYGDIAELSDPKGAPYVVTELALKQGQLPLIIAQAFDQDSEKMLRPLDEKNKAEYKKAILEFVSKYKPAYLGIGIEVNLLYDSSPQDFDDFVAFYNDVYPSVKSVSHSTKVFTVFQLEKMKGMYGGLFGGKESEQPKWELIDRFSTDIVAFTTYPCLVFHSPSDIPDDYYSDILNHVSKPVAFTEIGWYSSQHIAGWESSEAEQAEFVDRFFNLTKSLDAEFFIWSFLYDQKVSFPFSEMGLFSSNGPKQAWDVWLKER